MNKEKGITLIALIITIIIMLILVAVTVSVAVNGNLFGKAEDAVSKTNAKVGKLQQDVDHYTGKLNEVGNKFNNAEENRELIDLLEKQIKSLQTGSINAQSGIDLVQEAEGNLSELQDMLQRINELLGMLSNGAIGEEEEVLAKDEINNLMTEYKRIIKNAKYENQLLLTGNVSKQIVFGNGDFEQGNILVTVPDVRWETLYGSTEINYDDTNKIGEMISIITGIRATLGAKQNAFDHKINYLDNLAENITGLRDTLLSTDIEEAIEIGYIQSAEGGLCEVYDMLNRMIEITTQAENDTNQQIDRECIQHEIDELLTQIEEILEYAGAGTRTSFKGELEYVGETTLETLEISDLSVSTTENAANSKNKVYSARDKISLIRSKLGAKQNAFEHLAYFKELAREKINANINVEQGLQEAGLNEINSILTRSLELAIKGTNGTNSALDRETIMMEICENINAIDIICNYEYKGNKIINDINSNTLGIAKHLTMQNVTQADMETIQSEYTNALQILRNKMTNK